MAWYAALCDAPGMSLFRLASVMGGIAKGVAALAGGCCFVFLRSGREGCGERRILCLYAAAVALRRVGTPVLMLFAALMALGVRSLRAVNGGMSIW